MSARGDDQGLPLTDGTGQLLVVISAMLLIGVVIVGMIGAPFDGASNNRVETSGDTIDLASDPDSITLQDSTGYGASFGTGAGAITIPSDGNAGDGNTTAVVWTDLHDDALDGSNYHVANLGNGAASLQYRDRSWVAVVNVTGGGAGTVTAPAPSPHNWTMVGVRTNGTHVAIIRDGQIRNATEIDANASGNVPAARSWWGSQDELRVWDEPLPVAMLGQLDADPIGPANQSAVVFRAMLDEQSGSRTNVLRLSADATLHRDVRLTPDGLDPTEFVAGVDYRYDGGEIEIVDGSRLDQLRVAYVSYTSPIGELLGPIASSFVLAAVIPLGIAAITIWLYLDTHMGGRR